MGSGLRRSHTRGCLNAQPREEFRQKLVVKSVQVPKRGVRFPALLARTAPDANVLFVRNADDDLVSRHSGNFSASISQGWNVLQHLRAKDAVEGAVWKWQLCDITDSLQNTGIVNGRHLA